MANVLSFPAASQVYLLSGSVNTMRQLKVLSLFEVYPTVSHCHSSFHYTVVQVPNIYCPIQTSPCSNSKSWSQHQICDTSFFYITIKALLKGQVLYV